MQWHYSRGGKSFGPIEQDEMIAMARSGNLLAGDYVWNPTMGSQWAKASSVGVLFGEEASKPAAETAKPAVKSSAAAAAEPEAGAENPLTAMLGRRRESLKSVQEAGTLSKNGAITARARASLKGNWGLGIAVCVVLGLVAGPLMLVPVVGPLIAAGPLMVGYKRFFLALVRGQEPSFGTVFSGFKEFGTGVWAVFLMGFFLFLWMLAASLIAGPIAMFYVSKMGFSEMYGVAMIVPVAVMELMMIWVVLRYSQTLYVLASDPASSAREAISSSKEVMAGRKWKFICLNLRFVGWSIPCLLTCGVGFLWLMPYMEASMAGFYDNVAST